jgi:hypothetical protein
MKSEKELKVNRWPYILPDTTVKPNEEAKPVFDRLVKDTDKRMKAKERESNLQYTYRDKEIVKKDVYFEYDYWETLRSDRTGDREQRIKQFSPRVKQKQLELQML